MILQEKSHGPIGFFSLCFLFDRRKDFAGWMEAQIFICFNNAGKYILKLLNIGIV